MEQNCIRDIVMIIIYRPLSRSGFVPRLGKTFGLRHIFCLLIFPTAQRVSELEKETKTTSQKAQGQQQALSVTPMNKGRDKEQ